MSATKTSVGADRVPLTDQLIRIVSFPSRRNWGETDQEGLLSSFGGVDLEFNSSLLSPGGGSISLSLRLSVVVSGGMLSLLAVTR
jgi:hypothetical protein